MSDFFAGINNIRMPQVVMDQGPLPGMGGLPAPLHDTADARINYNSSLLGDIQPYAYGEPGYLSSQTAYLNIPHRIQKVIPTLYLPEPIDNTSFKLCHPVDEGDLAFVMRLNRNSEVCTGLNNRTLQRAGLGTAVDPFINLATLNYLLAGLQVCTLVGNIRHKWDQLMHHLDSKKYSGKDTQEYGFKDIVHIVENLIRPFGIVHGKDNQGGQSEGNYSSVQWPVSFVTNMILDGKDANIVNIWHYHDISAGDDLVLRLKAMPLPPGNKYTLNHYRKGVVEKTFPPNVLDEASLKNAVNVTSCLHEDASDQLEKDNLIPANFNITHVWQLVPEIFSLDLDDGASSAVKILETLDKVTFGLNCKFWNKPLPWQHVGYWHIARTQVQSKSYGEREYYYNDMAQNLRLGHIDSTFQPVFCQFPSKDCFFDIVEEEGKKEYKKEKKGSYEEGYYALVKARCRDMHADESSDAAKDARKAKSMSTAGAKVKVVSDAGKQFKTSLLRLGREALDTSTTSSATSSAKRSRIQLEDVGINNNSGKATRASVHPGLLQQLQASSSSSSLSALRVSFQNSSPLTEDIGVFDDPGPVSGGQSAESGIAEDISADLGQAVPTFTVPKPSLKSARKSSGRGKGVVSSVLGADGSIRLEQSSML
jgi:hypothetical protein